MAFNQNLEADTIDGFDPLSVFFRVPLLVLGGILGINETARSNGADSDSSNGRDISTEDVRENDDSSSENAHCFPIERDCTHKRQPSNTSTTDDSGINDTSEFSTGTPYKNYEMKRTKRMSWSDESGLPLVYENDESSTNHEHTSSIPHSPLVSSLHKPTKSAMRKSRSTRHQDHELSDGNRNKMGRSRYIPHMNPPAAGKGFIMPSRPYARYPSADNKILGSNSAEMSPQWGWYITTTPPTPELYHSKSTHQSSSFTSGLQSNSMKKGDQKASIATTVSSTSADTSCQNQVFQNLQNTTRTKRMGGWTSVPI